MQYNHTPVMTEELLTYLNCKPGKTYVDCTIGGAGHAKTILGRNYPNINLIGIDQDIDSIKNANTVLKNYKSKLKLYHDNFVNLNKILTSLNIKSIDGIILDLGISFHQIEASGRGFSFKKDEPLDMRMNIKETLKASDIIENYTEQELCRLFKKYGEEKFAKRISSKIVKIRKTKNIKTSRDLANLISAAYPDKVKRQLRIHPATKSFMALRIAVNKELERLEKFIQDIPSMLNPGARICVISFHSLEDRIIKHKFKDFAKECVCPSDFPKCVCNTKKKLIILTRKAIIPSDKEILNNPLSRSAKLRAAEKI